MFNLPMTPLSKRVEQAEEAGFTQAALARAAGITTGAVAHWATGRTKTLKSSVAQKLADATRWSAKWWATGEGPREQAPNYGPIARKVAALVDQLTPEEQETALRVVTSLLPEVAKTP